jgi:hypothetical protein
MRNDSVFVNDIHTGLSMRNAKFNSRFRAYSHSKTFGLCNNYYFQKELIT